MADTRREEDAKLEKLQQLLGELVMWSQGERHYIPCCTLCDAEGPDVQHDESCPVPEARRLLEASQPNVTLLTTFVTVFMKWGEAEGPDDCTTALRRSERCGTKAAVQLPKRLKL